jgi:NADPH-dependent 7-cyano-7-deazaguanine reductase QueF
MLDSFQPDWDNVKISYTGNQIDHASLLQCIERICTCF